MVVAIVFVGLKIVFGSKKSEIGDIYKLGNSEFSITDVIVSKERYIYTNGSYSRIFTPVNKNDLVAEDTYIYSKEADKSVIVITMNIKNIGKSDMSVYDHDFVIDYNDGYEYLAKAMYVSTPTGWEETEQAKIKTLGEGITIKAIVWVPTVAVTDTDSSLKLKFYNRVFDIR